VGKSGLLLGARKKEKATSFTGVASGKEKESGGLHLSISAPGEEKGGRSQPQLSLPAHEGESCGHWRGKVRDR